jgi:hypothetical protein
MTTDNCCFYLQNRLIQTSQTGGQRYSDTSPISIPCSSLFWWRRKESFVASTLSNWMIKVFSQTSRGQKNKIFPLHRLWTWRTWRMWRAWRTWLRHPPSRALLIVSGLSSCGWVSERHPPPPQLVPQCVNIETFFRHWRISFFPLYFLSAVANSDSWTKTLELKVMRRMVYRSFNC